MKKFFTLLFLSSLLACLANQAFSQERFTFGANYVHRKFKNYVEYSYPRLSAEYRVTRSSSFEILAEYIHVNKPNNTDFISCPFSLGYKLNYLPWFSKNQWVTSTFELYNSLRYVLVLYPGKNYAVHRIRYSPGINVFITKHWGLNGEMVFGTNMQTTFAIGIKYRL